MIKAQEKKNLLELEIKLNLGVFTICECHHGDEQSVVTMTTFINSLHLRLLPYKIRYGSAMKTERE